MTAEGELRAVEPMTAWRWHDALRNIVEYTDPLRPPRDGAWMKTVHEIAQAALEPLPEPGTMEMGVRDGLPVHVHRGKSIGADSLGVFTPRAWGDPECRICGVKAYERHREVWEDVPNDQEEPEEPRRRIRIENTPPYLTDVTDEPVDPDRDADFDTLARILNKVFEGAPTGAAHSFTHTIIPTDAADMDLGDAKGDKIEHVSFYEERDLPLMHPASFTSGIEAVGVARGILLGWRAAADAQRPEGSPLSAFDRTVDRVIVLLTQGLQDLQK